MAKIDPEQERSRLAEVYSRQSDEELEQVAAQASDLTETAREALRAELMKRDLYVGQMEQAPEASETELRDPVTIRRFRDLPEALLAKGGLESAGINVVLVDDNLVRLDWLISNFIGGVKLQVAPDDVEAAQQILDQPIPEVFEADGTGEFTQPRCPKCGSLDVSFQEVAPAAYVSMMVNVPIPFHRRAWRCHACNVEWEDDGNPDGSESAG